MLAWRRAKTTLPSRARLALRDAIAAALASMLAWVIAQQLWGHPKPAFAVVTAVICLAPGLPSHLKQARSLLIGCTLGIVIGDLLWQLPEQHLLLRMSLGAFLSILLGAIASISLLVGGIGIMNIMLVSVTERTREIGIRKALGATFLNIMTQFLIESMVIGIIGGIIGIGVGCAASEIIARVAGFTTVITWAPILISFLFSVGIGLFFGIYPARKAARLDPIEALRYE